VLRLRCEINSTSEYIENAAIHAPAHFPAEFGVKRLGVSTSEFRDLPDPEETQIGGYRRSNSRDP
jgi:hypothetical protein